MDRHICCSPCLNTERDPLPKVEFQAEIQNPARPYRYVRTNDEYVMKINYLSLDVVDEEQLHR